MTGSPPPRTGDAQRRPRARRYRGWMTDPAVPPADQQEQAEPVVPLERPAPLSDDLEVPEADALEQSEPVPAGDEDGPNP